MVLVLFLFCAPNICLPIIGIPKFEQMYRDVLPGQPLPALTQWIVTHPLPIAVAGAIWPIIGILLVWRLKLVSILWFYIPFILSFAQLGLTIYALFQPLLGVITSGSIGPHR